MSGNRSTDDLDALADRLRSVPEPPVPPGLESRLLAAIPDIAAFAPGPRRHRRGRLWLAGSLTAAAVLVAVLLGCFFGTTGQTPDRPHPRALPQVAEDRPRDLGHSFRPELDSSGGVTSGPALLSSTFEWPVQLPLPRAGHGLRQELAD